MLACASVIGPQTLVLAVGTEVTHDLIPSPSSHYHKQSYQPWDLTGNSLSCTPRDPEMFL